MLNFDVNFLTSTREPSRSPDASEEILSGFITSTVPSPPLLSSEDSRSSLEGSFGGSSITSLPLNSGGEEIDSPPRESSSGGGKIKSKVKKSAVKPRGKGVEKPGHSYIALISMAIFSTPQKKLVLGDIYKFIQEKFEYYKLCEDSAWKNSIRHNLSLNECFIKNGRADNGKGHYWSIHPACEEDFRKGDFRRRQARRRAKRCHQPAVTPQVAAYPYPPVTGGYVPMTQMPTGMGGSSYRSSAASYHPYLPSGGHTSYLSQPMPVSTPTVHATVPAPVTSIGGQYPSQYTYPAVPKPYNSTPSVGPPPNVNACQMGDFAYSRGTGVSGMLGTQTTGQAGLAPLTTDFANIPGFSSYGMYGGYN